MDNNSIMTDVKIVDESTQKPTASYTPPTPASLKEVGINRDSLIHLIVKILYYAGEVTGAYLASRLKLPYTIVDELIEFVKIEKMVEVKGIAGIGKSAYRYSITSLGRDRAKEFLEINQYTGPAPVPLAQYTEMLKKQAAARSYITQEGIAKNFSHLVLSKRMLDTLGPAINSGRSMFVYGGPGNGKSAVSETIGGMLGGEVFIPYAIDVDGVIITVFDPINHRAYGGEKIPDANGYRSPILSDAEDFDQRWVRCRRPFVFTGGELTLEMLDLSYNEISKFYEAPFQVKANGGVFLIDDFGRQLVRPKDLLNRWIVPLEKRVDYLTLHTGKKFEIPFDALIIFSTNLRPQELVDEAFFRRIRYKIHFENPTLEEYKEIFKNYCRLKNIVYNPIIVDYIQTEFYQKYGIEMRCCHPRDVIEQVCDISSYLNVPAALTKELIDGACHSYFVK
ncbi:MAG: ATP-binding protein [Acidobacteriota bacterium]